jgi:hypothetical protein
MNIKQKFLMLIVMGLSMGCEARPVGPKIRRDQANWLVLFNKYFPPMIVSAIIGAGTGGFVRHIEKEFRIDQSTDVILWRAVAWYVEFMARTMIITSIQKDFDDCGISYKRSLMNLSAWLASWMTYLNV